MALTLTLTDLPQDVLILVFLQLLVEDVLALMQTFRVMHALGSLDYLWHALISNWDIPLDIPLNAPLTSLSSNSLRLAAVKALNLDHRWRNPRIEMRRAQCIISRNFSIVDGMSFLPGGRWLVTLQHERMSMMTHVTLWSIADLKEQNSIFNVTVVGRVRFLHAHHHHDLEQITIAIAFARGTEETIRVYHVSLPGDSSTRHSLVFEARPGELHPMGLIAAMEINGDTMIAEFAPPSSSLEEQQRQIICVNLISKATAILDFPDWAFAFGRIKLFSRYFAVATSPCIDTMACVSFYELPSVVLDHPDCLSPSVPRWPEKQAVKSSLIASTSWCSDDPLACQLSDDAPTNNTTACSCTMFGYPITTQRDVESLIQIFHVSFDGRSIERTSSVVPCRFIPLAGEIRVSSSGRRAVWLTEDPGRHECVLMKFALGRGTAKGTGSCIATLMPPFSGLPFNPRDFHSFVFDEISCKMAVGLRTRELYILHYD